MNYPQNTPCIPHLGFISSGLDHSLPKPPCLGLDGNDCVGFGLGWDHRSVADKALCKEGMLGETPLRMDSDDCDTTYLSAIASNLRPGVDMIYSTKLRGYWTWDEMFRSSDGPAFRAKSVRYIRRRYERSGLGKPRFGKQAKSVSRLKTWRKGVRERSKSVRGTQLGLNEMDHDALILIGAENRKAAVKVYTFDASCEVLESTVEQCIGGSIPADPYWASNTSILGILPHRMVRAGLCPTNYRISMDAVTSGEPSVVDNDPGYDADSEFPIA